MPTDHDSDIDLERRQVTIMFCDLVGSTRISSQLDPEDLRQVIKSFHNAWTVVIENHHGYLAKFMGDGILAYFGYPYADEETPARSVLGRLEIIDQIPSLREAITRDYSVTTGVRIGIATGPVVIGDLIGRGAAAENSVVGQTPNLAARLQEVAEPDQLVVSDATRTLCETEFEFASLGLRQLKGIPDPVPGWLAIAPRAVAMRYDQQGTHQKHTLYGRKHDLRIY